MRARRTLLLVALIVLFASSAQAGSWKVELEKKTSGGRWITDLSRPFLIGTGEDGDKRFKNMTGILWTSFVISVYGAPEDDDDDLSDLDCDQEGGLFGTCNIAFTATPSTSDDPMTGLYVFTFTGGPGIAHGQSFEIDWDEWSDNPTTLYGSVPTSIPEPCTLALFMMGAAAVTLRRQLKPNRRVSQS